MKLATAPVEASTLCFSAPGDIITRKMKLHNKAKHRLLAIAAVPALGIVGTGLFPETANAAIDVCGEAQACNNFINTYVNPIVTLLTILVGVAAAISVVVAGIQYASAGDDPGKVQKAKGRIWQTVLGLLAYLFLAAFLNYIVPGGFL